MFSVVATSVAAWKSVVALTTDQSDVFNAACNVIFEALTIATPFKVVAFVDVLLLSLIPF